MKIQIVLLTAIALMLGACGKSNKNSTRANRTANNNINQSAGSSTCATNSWGRIYDNSASDEVFRQRVADFSFRSLNDLGTISGQYSASTGVEFRMTLAFSGGQLVQGSQASFKISDSFTINENAGYIHFGMNGQSGQGYSGQFNAVIGDTKGTVRFEGMRTISGNQQIVYGRVYYNNNFGEQYLGEFVNGACAVTGI